jgi:hypothetical protein
MVRLELVAMTSDAPVGLSRVTAGSTKEGRVYARSGQLHGKHGVRPSTIARMKRPNSVELSSSSAGPRLGKPVLIYSEGTLTEPDLGYLPDVNKVVILLSLHRRRSHT